MWTWGVPSPADGQAAERVKKKLAGEGLHSSLQSSTADATRQQVIIGDYKTQAEARRYAATLKTQGRFKGAWVTRRND